MPKRKKFHNAIIFFEWGDYRIRRSDELNIVIERKQLNKTTEEFEGKWHAEGYYGTIGRAISRLLVLAEIDFAGKVQLTNFLREYDKLKDVLNEGANRIDEKWKTYLTESNFDRVDN